MVIAVGDRLPAAHLLTLGADGPEPLDLQGKTAHRRVVIFGVPGAFTPTCSSAHLPSFIRTAEAFREKGIEEIFCLSVNDVHVMRHWGEQAGATAAGITMAADAKASFTKAIGMAYDNPAAGMFDRSRRYAMLVEDGVVKVLNVEASPRECEISAGETLLDQV